jgi:hypothetical protein
VADSDGERVPFNRAPDLGRQFETALARREWFADNYDIDFGHDRVFPELVLALLEEVPPDRKILEVGAATGLLTRPLLEHAAGVTAMEPSAGMLRRLLASDIADSPKLRTLQGVAEELEPAVAYDLAVVTFTPRRGIALLRLVMQLALRVSDRVVVLLPDDTSMDWAYLARAASAQGFDVRAGRGESPLVPYPGPPAEQQSQHDPDEHQERGRRAAERRPECRIHRG